MSLSGAEKAHAFSSTQTISHSQEERDNGVRKSTQQLEQRAEGIIFFFFP